MEFEFQFGFDFDSNKLSVTQYICINTLLM